MSMDNIHQVWYADDTTSCGSFSSLRKWWDKLVEVGTAYGYYRNAPKTWLFVKEHCYEKALEIFHGSDVSVTRDGRCVLGCPIAIGTDSFVTDYLQNKVDMWSRELQLLSNIALTQPQAAYSAFIHGILNRWTYLCRTCPNINNCLQSLEHLIRLCLIPSLTGRDAVNDIERENYFHVTVEWV